MNTEELAQAVRGLTKGGCVSCMGTGHRYSPYKGLCQDCHGTGLKKAALFSDEVFAKIEALAENDPPLHKQLIEARWQWPIPTPVLCSHCGGKVDSGVVHEVDGTGKLECHNCYQERQPGHNPWHGLGAIPLAEEAKYHGSEDFGGEDHAFDAISYGMLKPQQKSPKILFAREQIEPGVQQPPPKPPPLALPSRGRKLRLQ